jgi:hypothetical protein
MTTEIALATAPTSTDRGFSTTNTPTIAGIVSAALNPARPLGSRVSQHAT